MEGDKMIIKKESEKYITNKLEMLLELTRIDESTATLIEHEYDALEQVSIAEKMLEYLGFELELKRNPDREYGCAETLFDELQYIIDGLCEEIHNNDFVIHYNKKYGYDQPLEYYKKYNMIL